MPSGIQNVINQLYKTLPSLTISCSVIDQWFALILDFAKLHYLEHWFLITTSIISAIIIALIITIIIVMIIILYISIIIDIITNVFSIWNIII